MASQSQTHSLRSNWKSAYRKHTASADEQLLEERLYRRLESCGTSAHYFKRVELHASRGLLRIVGQVPTLGLKRMLWSIVCDEFDADKIIDELDVICSTGLSVIQPK